MLIIPLSRSAVTKSFQYLIAILFLLSALAVSSSAQSATDGTTPTGMAPGAPSGSYPLSGFDTINFFNGNLNFDLPLLKVGGRGSAGHAIQLKIERKWQTSKPGPGYPYFPDGDDWPTLTTGYSAGFLEGRVANLDESCMSTAEMITLLRYTFKAPDGTEYELSDTSTGGGLGATQFNEYCQLSRTTNRGRVFTTKDGTSATFVADYDVLDYMADGSNTQPSGYLLMKDGTRYRIDTGMISWVRDRNGNRITYSYTGSLLTGITDSLGRTVSFSYHSTSQSYDQISFYGQGGAARNIFVRYTTLSQALRSDYPTVKTLHDLFPELAGASTSTNYNPTVASSVELPDVVNGQGGHQYHFKYNPYGELARVELPTGGAMEYDWEAGLTGGYASGVFDASSPNIYRRVVERRVYDAGGTGSSYTSRITVSKLEDSSANNLGYVIVEQRTPPDQNYPTGKLLSKDIHYYHGSSYQSFIRQPQKYAPWKEGKEWKTETYDTNGTTVLRRVEQTWQQPTAGNTWPLTQAETNDMVRANNPQITQTISTLVDSNQVTKQTFAYDQYGNQTDVYEYDYGTSSAPAYPTRHSQTSYLTTNSVNSLDYASSSPTTSSIHIRNLPQEQKVYSVNTQNGAETLVSRSLMAYDQGSLTPYTSVVGLCDTIDVNNQCVWSNPTSFITRGNLTSTTAYTDAANGTGALTTSMVYDIAGNLVQRTDARGKVVNFGYNDAFSDSVVRNTYAFPTSTTSPVPDPTGNYGSTSALTTSTVYDYSTGHATSSKDANDRIISFDYNDTLDRLTSITRPDTDTNSNHGTTTYSYGDTIGNNYVRTQVKQSASQIADSYQYFDGLGRATRSFMYDGNSSEPWSVVDQHYDAFGRASQVSNPYRVSTSNGTVPNCSSSIPCTTTDYDDLGRIKSVTTPDNAIVLTSYKGNQVLVTDQVGRQRMSKTNALGQLTEVWEITPNNSSSYPGIISFSFGAQTLYGYLTHYDYDVLGNLTNVSQGVQTRAFTYDSLSRLKSATNPEVCHQQGASCTPVPVTYQYDDNGNLMQKTDARGIVTTYAYDNLNRNTTITYTNDPADTPAFTRIYDKALDSNGNAVTVPNGKGRLCQSKTAGDEGTLTTISSYDAMGRPLSQSTQFYSVGAWSAPFNVGRTYDLAGHVLTQSYPSGHSVAYNYDLAGRLNDFNNQAAFSGNLGDGETRTYTSSLQYDSASRLQQEKYGTLTPLYHKLHYNVRGQLWDVRLSTRSMQTNEWDWNRGAVVSYYSSINGYAGGTSGTDNNGNLLRSQSWIPINDGNDNITGSQSSDDFFEYDALNRLTSINEYSNLTNALPSPGDQQTNYQGSQVAVLAQKYSYDRYGNRTIDQSGTSGTGVNNLVFGVNASNNRLIAPANYQPLEYDLAGNLTKDSTSQNPTATSLYDAENRLSAISVPSENVCYPDGEGGQNCYPTPQPPPIRYIYDADGRRVRRYSVLEKIWQVYGMDGELLSEYYQGTFAGGFEQDAPVTNIIPRKEYGYRSGQLLITASNGDDARIDRFITNFYYATLGREPQDDELPQQRDLLLQAGSQSEAQFLSAAQRMGRELFDVTNHSSAYYLRNRTNAQYVKDLYNAYLQRAPESGDPGGYVSYLNGFSGTALDQARLDLRASFESSGEFTSLVSTLYGINNSTSSDRVQRYVSTLYIGAQNGGSQQSDVAMLEVVSAEGQTQVIEAAQSVGINAYQSWLSPTDTRTNQDYVTALFEGLLQREPSSDELRSGMQQVVWLGRESVLSTFTSLPAVQSLAGTLYREMLWMTEDQLGTPRMITERSGSLAGVKRHDYLPFGEELTAGTGGRTTQQGYVGDNIRQKFTGTYERDSETGLDYAKARYYSSTMGRYTSVDPIVATPERFFDPQQFNLYSYTRNNPLRFIDPTGEKLVISGGLDEIKKQLAEMLGTEDAAKRITFNEKTGVITVDLKGIDLTKNEGASLLSDVIGSEKVYGLTVGSSVETLGGQLSLIPTKDNPIIPLTNLDNNPDNVRYSKGKTDKNKPPKGFDDQIGINYDFFNKNTKSTTKLPQAPYFTVSFHELAEAYAKVEHNKQYAQAHQEAIDRETRLRDQRPYLKGYNPGSGPGTEFIIRK